jgi:hypothetical protein
MLQRFHTCRWLALWRKSQPGRDPASAGFSARLRVVHDEGWVSLELLLINRSDAAIWVEDATVALSDLVANWQTANPAGQAKHKILQNVGLLDTLRVSLAGAIYDAAGRPQDAYSCLVHTVVHYRFFDEWYRAELESCRIAMAALTVLNILRPRWYDKKLRQIKGLVDLRANERQT